MDERIRIKEAILIAKKKGRKIVMGILAGKIFTYTTPHSAYIRLNKYIRGESVNMSKREIHIICNELEVDPNFLYGWSRPMQSDSDKQDEPEVEATQ